MAFLVSGRPYAKRNPTSLPLWSVEAAPTTIGMKTPDSNPDGWDSPGASVSQELSLDITSLGERNNDLVP